jgi:hypothetical protein
MDPASECHKRDLIQRRWDFVGGDVVLDVVGNAPAEGLDGEPKQSPLDSKAVLGHGVFPPLKKTLDVKRRD